MRGHWTSLFFFSSGFVRCEGEEEPQLISFLPNFDKGALLTIVRILSCFLNGMFLTPLNCSLFIQSDEIPKFTIVRYVTLDWTFLTQEERGATTPPSQQKQPILFTLLVILFSLLLFILLYWHNIFIQSCLQLCMFGWDLSRQREKTNPPTLKTRKHNRDWRQRGVTVGTGTWPVVSVSRLTVTHKTCTWLWIRKTALFLHWAMTLFLSSYNSFFHWWFRKTKWQGVFFFNCTVWKPGRYNGSRIVSLLCHFRINFNLGYCTENAPTWQAYKENSFRHSQSIQPHQYTSTSSLNQNIMHKISFGKYVI